MGNESVSSDDIVEMLSQSWTCPQKGAVVSSMKATVGDHLQQGKTWSIGQILSFAYHYRLISFGVQPHIHSHIVSCRVAL